VLELSASADTGYNFFDFGIVKDIARTLEQNISAVIWIEIEVIAGITFFLT
jgi:hypothetical protein